MMETIRASSLPLISKCPASFQESKGLPNEGSEAARLGSMKHKVYEMVGKGEQIFHGGLALTYGCSIEDVEQAEESAQWVKEHRPGWDVDYELALYGEFGPIPVTGHPDLVASNPDEGIIEVHDFKTGRLLQDPAERNYQGLAYLCMAQQEIERNHPGKYTTYRLLFHYTQHRKSDVAEWTAEEIREISYTIKAILTDATGQSPEYHVGDHCQYCKAKGKCPVFNRAIAPVLHGKGLPMAVIAMPPAQRASTWGMLQAAKKLVADTEKAFYQFVSEHGPLDLGDGREWGPQEETWREIYDLRAAWPILDRYLGEFMGDCVSIAVGEMDKAAAKKYRADNQTIKSGAIGKNRKALNDELKDAFAMRHKTVKKMKVTHKSIEEENAA